MNPLRSCLVTVLTLAALGCHGDAVTNSPVIPSAATTWMNAVSDTGQLDIRVVDIPSNAGFFDANFRDALQFPQAIEAGRRHVRVFLSSTDPAITQQTLVDTTYDFVVDQRYGFYVTGFARASQTPAVRATIVPAPAATLGANQFGIRVLNVAPSFAGAVPTLADTTVRPDVFVRRINTLPGGTPDAASVAYLGVSSYVALDTGLYRLEVTATGTTGPAIVQVPLPVGAAGTPTTNPIARSLVPGTVLTALIVPRSVVGSKAPQGGTPSSKATEVLTRSNDTVTVQSGSITNLVNRGASLSDTTIAKTGTGATTGVKPGDVVLVSGATEPDYNGWQVVMAVADSLSCKPTAPADTRTKCAAANDTATTRFRFRYRIAAAPASPATGTASYRIYTTTTADFTLPYVSFVVDRRPPDTTP